MVWVELLGCRVAGGRDVWLSEVGVGVGVELWRRLWCLLSSPWVVCCVWNDCLVLSCRVRLSRVSSRFAKFHVFCLILARFVFCLCDCVRRWYVCARGEGRGYVTRVSRGARSFIGDGESTAWRRDCEGVSQMCARLRGSSRFLVVLFVFLRVSCSVCVIVLGADVSESARCERAGG